MIEEIRVPRAYYEDEGIYDEFEAEFFLSKRASLGRGGQSTVFKAYQNTPERNSVAIKVYKEGSPEKEVKALR